MISSGPRARLLPVATLKHDRLLGLIRSIRQQAFEASFDPAELEDARRWHASFNEDQLPSGQTSYSRSSGPGGQHVNKTESKATTVWTVGELIKTLPQIMHAPLRSSKYYTSRNDSITIQAQTQRSRAANTDENQQKLVEELRQIYKTTVPGTTSAAKMHKWEQAEKGFHASRVKSKKLHGSKKALRRPSYSD